MKIVRVKVENYRNVKECKFAPSDLCALIGPNNGGKSNILRALNLVLGESWPSVRPIDDGDFYGHEEDRDIRISVWFDEQREVRGDVGTPAVFSGIQFTCTRYKRKSGKHARGDLRSEFLCIDDNGESVKILRTASPGAKPYATPAKVTGEIRDALPCLMIDIDRNAPYHLSGSQYSILGRLLRDVAREFKADKKRYADFMQKFGEARRVLRTPAFEKLEEKVVEHLAAHTGLPDVEVQLDELDPLNIYKNFSILFKDPDTPEPVDSARMGSGIQSAVVISLLQAYREIRKDNAVLLFEEPELYLHPHGRRHLFRLLCDLVKNGTQVIYTTHSQDFVDLWRVQDVRLVSKTLTDGTTVNATVGDLPGPDDRKRLKFTRQFSAPRNEMFFAKSVVIVEGQTDQAAIEMCAEMMPDGLDLDRLDCSVIEAGGKGGIPLIVKVARSLGLPFLAVYDTDSDKTDPNDIATNNRTKQNIEAACTGEGTTITFDPYLEEEIGIPGTTKKDKEPKLREYLAGLVSWHEVPEPLKNLMAAVKAISTPTDRIPAAVQPDVPLSE